MSLLTGFFTVNTTEMASTTLEWAGYVWDSISVFIYVILGVLLTGWIISKIIGSFGSK